MLRVVLIALTTASLATTQNSTVKPPRVDLSGHDASCGVLVETLPKGLSLRWPTEGGGNGRTCP